MTDEAVTTTLVFYVNGRKVIDSNPDPGETLLTYLRNKLRSPSALSTFRIFVITPCAMVTCLSHHCENGTSIIIIMSPRKKLN